MQAYNYELFLDNDYFYKRCELITSKDKLYKNALYLKNDEFIKKFFNGNVPTDSFFMEVLKNKGLYMFLLSLLEDNKSYALELVYTEKIIISKATFFEFYNSLLSTIKNPVILTKLHLILEYNTLPDEELLDYVTDDNCFNELFYKKDISSRDKIIKELLDYINENNIKYAYFLKDDILKRIDTFASLINYKFNNIENHDESVCLNEQLLTEINMFIKKTYSDLEKAIYYFIRLNELFKIDSNEELSLSDIFKLSIGREIDHKTFIRIYTELLTQNNIKFYLEESDKTSINVENTKFVIDSNLDQDYLKSIKTTDIKDDEKVYHVLTEINDAINKKQEQSKAIEILNEKTTGIVIDEKDKFKTFLELITRGDNVNDIDYQRMIFTLFYKKYQNYGIDFYKIKEEDGNYSFITILRKNNQFIKVDENEENYIVLVDNNYINDLIEKGYKKEEVLDEQNNAYRKN